MDRAALAQQVIIDDSESARTIVVGRVVNVEPVLVEGTRGGLQASVRISTIDDRGLPPIDTVRIRVIDRRQAPWSAYMHQYARSVFDETELYVMANGGPRVPIGSLVSVRVDIVTGGRFTSVTIPVTVRAF
jgi:hypothetical protein